MDPLALSYRQIVGVASEGGYTVTEVNLDNTSAQVTAYRDRAERVVELRMRRRGSTWVLTR